MHESVQVRRRVGQLKGNILHFTCDSLSEHLPDARPLHDAGRARNLAAHARSVPHARLIIDPAWTFVQDLVLQRGFLDGPKG